MYIGLGRQAEDITLGRMRRGRKSDGLTHASNGHDSAAIGSWRLLTLHGLWLL